MTFTPKFARLETPVIRAQWPRCVHKVRLSESMTGTRRMREKRAADRGTPPEQCGTYATHRIDGDPYCRTHAGKMALDLMLRDEQP